MPANTQEIDMPKRILVQCSTEVDRNAVTRKTINGVEHIVISSKTLPDDIVMNGGLYPASEIASSFQSLERTLAPVEHPHNSDGSFISASDPIAIHNFYAGAFNENVRREDGRVSVDKVINVQEALKTDRGKRLLDRVAELETNSNPRPIHTSVGVFLEVEETDGLQTNAAGQEYSWVARNMVFDHDAILLESVGAAQPNQGVGMAVNSDGESIEVQTSLVTIEAQPDDEMSHTEIRDALDSAIRVPPLSGDWVTDIIGDKVIFYSDEEVFSAPFIMDGRQAKIVGIPVPVVRNVTYTPKTNHQGDAMKELILKALSDAGITVNAEITDEELMVQYNKLLANQNSSDDDGASDDKAIDADVVANAIQPLLEKLNGLEAKLNEKATLEIDSLATIVGNSDKYAGLDTDAAKKLDIETLKSMAANCGVAHGVPLTVVNGGKEDEAFASFDMPK